MIVEKPISVKINGVLYRLKVGQTAPAVVVDFWKSDNQIEVLKKQGAISEEKTATNKQYAKKEVKEEKTGEEIESIFKTEE